MININLLPWREENRLAYNKVFRVHLIASVGVVLLVMLVLHVSYAGKLNWQLERNDFLQQEIKTFDIKIKQINLLEKNKQAKIANINALLDIQSNRYKLIRTFNGLAEIVPAGLYLTYMRLYSDTITIEGRAMSNSQITAFTKQFTELAWIASAELSEIKTLKNNKGNQNLVGQTNEVAFKLEVLIQSLS